MKRPLVHIAKIGISLCAAFCFLFFAPFVFAEESAGVKISPTLIEEKVDPGEVKAYVVHIENTGATPLRLFALVRDIVGVGPDGRPIYAEASEEDTYRLSSWVSFAEKDFNLRPGAGADMHVTVRVPANVEPGGHFGSIMVSQEGPKDIPQGSGVGFEVGAILSLQVKGDVHEETIMRAFFADKTIYGDPDAKFTVRIENLGNVVARPQGLIDITNMWGRKVVSIPVNENRSGVFPKSTREFIAGWRPEDVQFGRFQAVATFSVEGTQGNQTIWRETSFWVLPSNILYPMTGGLLGFVLLLWIILRLSVRRALRAHGVSGRRIAAHRQVAGLSRLGAVVIALLLAVILGLAILFVFFG